MNKPATARGVRLTVIALAITGLMASGLTFGATRAASATLVANPIDYVEVFGGTAAGPGQVGDINDFPGPAMPFGMVQLAPDTNGTGSGTTGTWSSSRNGAGYKYGNTVTRGFSMTHASQGCALYGDFPIMPSTITNLTATGTSGPWGQRLQYSGKPAWPTKDPSIEYGEVGYYRLSARDNLSNLITTEMSATTRAATMTFTFPAGTTPKIFFKSQQTNNSSVYGSQLRLDKTNQIIFQRATVGNFCSKL
ncbi:MAG: hypothetical protein LBQ92_00215, partial [Propionibacteriaceae bacterium]|nr:hypothetical protein [Propionibacteriaceae bacterium]